MKSYPEWSKLLPEPGPIDPSILIDPNLTIKLGKELQKRIGTLPRVEVHAFHLEFQPGEIVRMLRVQPQSYSEIARAIRAARTMKLTVRACGQRTGGDTSIYGTTPTVLVDCTQLADSPRMEFVNIHRKGEQEETPGLRVLSGVSINELVTFQLIHKIEIAQSVETTSVWGTVVGAITATTPGLVGPAGGATGGCLSDEVICIRIVDCHGDLITYSSPTELSSALSTLGLLGVVYDVTLRYKPITLTNVNYKFIRWSELCDPNSQLLRDSLANDMFTELIYLPFNSCNVSAEKELTDLNNWDPMNDEVVVRTGQRVIPPDEDPSNPSVSDSKPREQVHLLDPVFGPEPKAFVRTPEKTPWLLASAHHYLRCRFQPNPNSTQFTPWAVNALGKITEPLRQLRFTTECDQQLNEFPNVVSQILELIKELALGGSHKLPNFAVNLGMRIHFTGGTQTGRLLGVGFEPEAESSILAHITFNGITNPGPNTMWTQAATRMTAMILKQLPRCVPQWKTEWHGLELITQRYHEVLSKQVDPLKQLVAIADRDGVFLNELVKSILYTESTFYQNLYRKQRIDALSRL
ncbi:unnamed protein product [Echinostoma caproni]|uniref:FAD-binding PCMH-type domain-containing protein n=1 Tax=Echinostoma caproni TaxID=27848 RepID=A0A183ABH3_9TREM|nr:unnamed protein product [Echinostoma caproni]